MTRISRRQFVAAPAEEVWALAVDFDRWHPKLRRTAGGPEVDAGVVVDVRERDDATRTLRYHMPQPPFPITDHLATIIVETDQDTTSYVEWSADFSADPEVLHRLEDEIGDDVFVAALDQLASVAQENRDPR